jgi:hypothetical protein
MKAEAARKRLITGAGLAVGAVVAAAVIAIVVVSGGASSGLAGASSLQLKLGSLASLGKLQPSGSPGSTGPEGIPVPSAPALAGTATMASGNDVDGAVSCLGQEQTLFHIHAHLTMFVDGAARQIPYGIGITNGQPQSTPQGSFVSNGNCYYFLHTHAADGIIHIESPVQRTYTLGNFFDVWGQPLGPNRVGTAAGPVTAFYDGKPYLGNPRNIPLNAHAEIQLDVGRPLAAPESITFANNL